VGSKGYFIDGEEEKELLDNRQKQAKAKVVERWQHMSF